MNVRAIVAALLLGVAPVGAMQTALAAPVPKEQLIVPPTIAEHYVVVSDAGKHGDMWRWKLPDGSTAMRHSQSLRGWITETDATIRYGADGRPIGIVVRGITPQGDAAETYAEEGGNARWTSVSESGSGAAGNKFYLPAGGPGLLNARLVEQLASAGEQGIELLPSGRASMTVHSTHTIKGPAGPKQVKLAFLRGIRSSPVGWTRMTNISPMWAGSPRFPRGSRPMPRRCGTFRSKRPPPR